MNLTAVYVQEGAWIAAWIEEIPGVNTQGATMEEARANLRASEHRIYPYLLRHITAQEPNHIWGCDITYIRLRHGWLYLVAILDWYSRYVVSWALDETLEIGFVLDAIAQARQVATPTIWNTDQGSHFTSPQVTQPWLDAGVQISMDGRGRAYDNIFVSANKSWVKLGSVW